MIVSTGGTIRGKINPISAVIRQEINGEYSCQVSIALSDNLAEYFVADAIVYLDDANGTTQQFRLERPERTLDTLTAFGWHITYDLAQDMIVSKKYTTAAGSTVWADLLQAGIQETRFTGAADSSDTNSLTIVRQSVLSALIGSQDNSYLSRWGGEIDRDNFTVSMKTQLGENRNYRVIYRKNLTGIHVTVDNSTVVNRIVPTYLNASDAATQLPEVYIDSANIADTAVPHARHIHYSDIRVGATVDEAIPYPTTASAEAEVRARVAALYASGIDVPLLTVEIGFVQLRNTLEYADYAALEEVQLGDTIGAEYEDYSWTSRVVAYEWDAALSRYNNITLGNVRPSASDMSNRIVDAATIAANAALADRASELTGAIATAQTTADGKNTVYYSSTEPTGGTYIENDIWFDTDNSNKMYLHDGSAWVAVQFGENAIADLAITNAKIADATIQAAKIGTVDAGSITAGTVDAARIAASSITFDKLASAAVTSITDTIDLGGRNLLKDSDKDVTNSNYSLTSYTWANVSDMVPGEQYTITIEGTLPAGLSWYLNLYAQNPTAYPAWAYLYDSDKVSANKWVKTVTMPSLAVGQSFTGQTSLYQFPLGGGQTVSATRIKIERGNKATDWTPAPEDKLSEGVSYAGVEIDATNGFVSTATIGGNTIKTKANATEGFSIFKGASKIFGVDTDGNLFSSRLSNAETPTAWSIVGEITQGGTTRRGIFGYNSSYSSSDPGFMFLVPSYGGMTGLVQNGETIAFSDAYTSPSVVSNHYLLSLGEANGCGSLLFGAYDGAGSYEAGMDLHYNDLSGFWEFTLDVGDTPLTINDAGFRYDGEPVWYQGNIDFATGTGTSSSSAGGDTTVSFGKTFSSTPVVCANTTGANSYTCRIKSVSTTGFVLVVSGASIGFNYIAVLA